MRTPKFRASRRHYRPGGLAMALTLAAAMPAAAELPRLYTNQQMIEDVTKRSTLAIDDPLAVFAFVLDSLPDKVTVHPTENYFYFWFYHNGTRYAGNIRIDVLDRDSGYVHFAYYKDLTAWNSGEPDMKYMRLDPTHGVMIDKLEPLLYRVSLRRKSVAFALNDLSKHAPPPAAIGPDEKYLGPVFDESAIGFFLLFNTKLKAFHYILDETVTVADELIPARSTDRIVIGRRTGFAFYRDHRRDRKLLIGVFEANARLNNYYDGPFDQLPDNFIRDDALRDAIVAVAPDLKGKIDRYGIAADEASRYMIGPYLHYRQEAELDRFHQCATRKALPAERYYTCFVVGDPPQPRQGRAKKK